MVIAVTGRKGGAGKSTVALHLAGSLSSFGPTAALDLDDDNRTLAEYAKPDALPFAVHTPDTWREASREPWRHVVIDAPARPTRAQLAHLAERADVLIVPTPADAVSLRVLARTLPDIPAGKYRVLIVRAPPRPSRDAERARASLERGRVPVFTATIPEAAAIRHGARLHRLAWETGRGGIPVRLAFDELAEELTRGERRQ